MHFELELTEIFFLVDLGWGAAVGGMRLEINTGYRCYLICNNSRHKMALQSITEPNIYSSFSDILVFVFPMYLSLYLISYIFTITFMTFSQSFLWHPRLPRRSTALDIKCSEGGVGRRGEVHLLLVSVIRILEKHLSTCSTPLVDIFSQRRRSCRQLYHGLASVCLARPYPERVSLFKDSSWASI